MKKKKVYLINLENTEHYKIGITSQDPAKRIKQLQTGTGINLILIETFETRFGYKLETLLHKYYEQYCSNSEWFIFKEQEVKKFIATCSLLENNLDVLEKHNSYLQKNQIF